MPRPRLIRCLSGEAAMVGWRSGEAAMVGWRGGEAAMVGWLRGDGYRPGISAAKQRWLGVARQRSCTRSNMGTKRWGILCRVDSGRPSGYREGRNHHLPVAARELSAAAALRAPWNASGNGLERGSQADIAANCGSMDWTKTYIVNSGFGSPLPQRLTFHLARNFLTCGCLERSTRS